MLQSGISKDHVFMSGLSKAVNVYIKTVKYDTSMWYLQVYRLVKVAELMRLVSALNYGKYIFHIPAAVLVLNLDIV